jgi:oligopeptide transport system permease protein
MLSFIFKRLLYSLPVFFLVVSATFLFMRLAPGSPFGADRKLSADIETRLLSRYQLDGSIGQQFLGYWGNLLKGDLGDSIKYRNRSVVEIIGQTFPKSAVIGFGALLLALGIGVVAGSHAAIHHGTFRDHAAMGMALMGICLPSFVLAPLLVLLLAITFPIFPVAGWGTLSHLVLPIICLGVPFGAYCARLMRTSMLDVLNQDFIRTARAKGLDEKAVTYRHALRVASLPLVNYAGPLAANILTGSLVVEEIFKIPGMGPFFVNAVLSRDIFLVGGCVIVYFSLLIVLNLLSDISIALLDRRIRLW